MEIMGDLQLDFSGNKSFCIFVWEQCNSGTDCTAYGDHYYGGHGCGVLGRVRLVARSPNFKLGSCSLSFAIIYQQQNSMVVK